MSFIISWSLFKLVSIESVMPSNHLIFCHPLLLLLSVFPSIRVFSNESALRIRWPKYWSFSFSISPSNEYSGLISFRIDWFHLLAGKPLQHSCLENLMNSMKGKKSLLSITGKWTCIWPTWNHFTLEKEVNSKKAFSFYFM